MRLFDGYLAVDWSAANQPTTGKDSIWIASRTPAGQWCENISTRTEAIARIEEALRQHLASGERLLVGFDFGFGYPAGFAAKLGVEPHWDALWKHMASYVEDDDRNRSNRFELASTLNEEMESPLFWGRPHQHKDRYPHLPATKPAMNGLSERRVVEGLVPSAKSVFQMAYNGAVGSQTMLGIARLEGLRTRMKDDIRIWPFETGFERILPEAPSIIVAEIYPTLFLPKVPSGEIKDRAQVLAVAERLDALDRRGELRHLLAPPPGVSEEEKTRMLTEEGSIVGAGIL